MGTGSGYIGFVAESEGIKEILLVDINKNAISSLNSEIKKTGSKAKAIHSDLFSNINKQEKFDIIVFNTPYLPKDETIFDPALHGGIEGNEVAIEFLKEAKEFLSPKGIIILLTSSLAKPSSIESSAKENNYSIEIISTKKIFFEELIIYKLKQK
jgi:release factor glutamine methyltransferase